MDSVLGFIVDVVGGKVAEKALEAALRPTWACVRSILFPNWEPASKAIRLQLEEHLQELHQRDGDVIEALNRSLEEGEANALATSFLRAAAQATTDEKMKMLVAAAAGVFTPDLDSEMRSRVSRAVVELEPSDVLALRRALTTEPFKGTAKIGDVATLAIPVDRVYEGLLHAGCIADANVAGGGVYVTERGKAVAKSLAAWQVNGTP